MISKDRISELIVIVALASTPAICTGGAIYVADALSKEPDIPKPRTLLIKREVIVDPPLEVRISPDLRAKPFIDKSPNPRPVEDPGILIKPDGPWFEYRRPDSKETLYTRLDEEAVARIIINGQRLQNANDIWNQTGPNSNPRANLPATASKR